MRRAVGFVALVVLMVLLHRLTDAGPVEARATLALGFLLLVALLAGDIAVRYGMPRLIGAFLFGFPLRRGFEGVPLAAALPLIDEVVESIVVISGVALAEPSHSGHLSSRKGGQMVSAYAAARVDPPSTW